MEQYVFVKTNAPDNDQSQRRPISKDNYRYLESSRKILSQEMLMCIKKTLIFII